MKGVGRPGFGGRLSRARLRLAFIGVGTLLLCGLGFLAHLASQRLEEARADRERMVASRVFDEMEREVSAFLESETDRPPYSDLQATNPENWAPFVVGYFARARTDVAGSGEVVVAEGPTREHERRVRWAIEQAREEFEASTIPAEPSFPGALLREAQGDDEGARERKQAPRPLNPSKKDAALEEEKAAPPAPQQQQRATGSQIIDSLNRAPERRKGKQSKPSKSESSDPFSDYLEAY